MSLRNTGACLFRLHLRRGLPILRTSTADLDSTQGSVLQVPLTGFAWVDRLVGRTRSEFQAQLPPPTKRRAMARPEMEAQGAEEHLAEVSEPKPRAHRQAFKSRIDSTCKK